MSLEGNDKKGFGGFEDLVSDVSKDIEKPFSASHTPSSQVPPNKVTEQSSSLNPQPEQTAAPVPTSTQGGKSLSGSRWLWIIGIILVIAWLSNMGGRNNTTSTVQTNQEQIAQTSNTQSQDIQPNVTESQARNNSKDARISESFVEERPPQGYGLVFSVNQIRYCQCEEIRLTTIKNAIDSNSPNEIDRFNASVEDYNSRCANFKYRRGLLESVTREVNARHASLVDEGLNRLEAWKN